MGKGLVNTQHATGCDCSKCLPGVYNVRRRGRVGGWRRIVAGASDVYADDVIRHFIDGAEVSEIAENSSITVAQVENVLRWYFRRPYVVSEVLGV